jgi:AraC family transcriptional regulator, regulatory protein of adaptative response / DNA-3-methyladenine glycosylase II
VRQFNDTMRETYGRSPSQLREARRGSDAPATGGTMTLRLPYREPLHAESLLEFLGGRTIAGVDEVRDGRYRRGLRLPHGEATVDLEPRPGYVEAVLCLADVRDLAPAVARCRRLLDLDADPVAVDALLAQDPALAPFVAKEPGVRVPGAVDGFEIAVRGVVGQQISVAGARTVLARLAAAARPDCPADHDVAVMIDAKMQRQAQADASFRAAPEAEHGDLRGFPSAEEVAEAPDSAFGMPAARRRTLRTLAAAVAEGRLRLDPGADREEAEARLVELPGIGLWTAQYVALRALGDPDVLLPTDLGVRRGAAAIGLPDEPAALARHAHDNWAPWRSYATIRLWRHA